MTWNMNVLAMSADVENVCIDPNELGLSGQDLDAIADKLSSLLNVSAEKIRTLMEDTSYRYQIVKRKVEQEEAASVRAYLSEENITGVYLEPDTRRYYPYGTLAAQVLGFVGSDNTGLDGIEAAENQTLTGSNGSIATAKGNYGTQMQFHFEQYADSVNGCDVVLTIDQTVQEMHEKHMRRPSPNTSAKRRIRSGDGRELRGYSLPGDPGELRSQQLCGDLRHQTAEELSSSIRQPWRNPGSCRSNCCPPIIPPWPMPG